MQQAVNVLSKEELAKAGKTALSSKDNSAERVDNCLASDQMSTSGVT